MGGRADSPRREGNVDEATDAAQNSPLFHRLDPAELRFGECVCDD